MATDLKIDARTLSIDDTLQDFYTVPDFQRQYVWQESNVESLLTDILDEFERQNLVNQSSEYFIGSIVVCHGEDETTFSRSQF